MDDEEEGDVDDVIIREFPSSPSSSPGVDCVPVVDDIADLIGVFV